MTLYAVETPAKTKFLNPRLYTISIGMDAILEQDDFEDLFPVELVGEVIEIHPDGSCTVETSAGPQFARYGQVRRMFPLLKAA